MLIFCSRLLPKSNVKIAACLIFRLYFLLFYVGKTNRTLFKRFEEYIKEKKGEGKPRKKVYKMLNQYDGHLYFYYTEISTKSEVDVTEEILLNVFVPHVNTSIPEAKIQNELKNIYERN